jgi:hypothetical protein
VVAGVRTAFGFLQCHRNQLLKTCGNLSITICGRHGNSYLAKRGCALDLALLRRIPLLIDLLDFVLVFVLVLVLVLVFLVVILALVRSLCHSFQSPLSFSPVRWLSDEPSHTPNGPRDD